MLDIIITTYNNPDYLSKSLASLVSQTNQEFVLTIVNDGSTESYDEVINKYKGLLEFNYIENKKNIGPGLSRQVGIDNTYEEYFMFLDSDDRLFPYAVQSVHECIKQGDFPDLVLSPFYTQVYNNLNKMSKILKSGDISKTLTWHHGKVYRRSKINQFNIKVPEEFSYIADDGYYNATCVELLKKKVTSTYPFYLWVQNPNSITHTRNLKDEETQTYVMNAVIASALHCIKYKPSLEILNKVLENMIKKNELVKITPKMIDKFKLLGVNYKNNK